MKISLLFLSVAVVATLVSADECSMDDGTSACPDVAAAHDATSKDYCTPDCVDFMSSMLDELPDCSTEGVNIKAGIQAAIDYCETGTADTSDVLTPCQGSTATAGSSSLRSGSSSGGSTSTIPDSTSSDKVTASTIPPASGSSTASSIGITISSVVFAIVAFISAAGL
ncbi:hypothetical protein GN244_ATG09705 [Phytophthora infestans]|uniref:Elicitin-like protein n=1 Tax=Phytophthora infestans TaxID=4787 RepID=A0A833T6F3_PHYIN|nr:hypothetical protein GN244_ATG09705 [Phytophthora infestans]